MKHNCAGCVAVLSTVSQLLSHVVRSGCSRGVLWGNEACEWERGTGESPLFTCGKDEGGGGGILLKCKQLWLKNVTRGTSFNPLKMCSCHAKL